MKDEFKEVNENVTKEDVVEVKDDLKDENEPLDLGGKKDVKTDAKSDTKEDSERDDFLASLRANVETRENVEEKDVERLKKGEWDTSSHKPGGIARMPGKKIKGEDDPVR